MQPSCRPLGIRIMQTPKSRWHRPALISAISTLLVGCSTAQLSIPGPPQIDVVLVYLTSGPTSGSGDNAQRAAMFQGHMANIKRLAEERQLLIAGPFDKPTDNSWRGLLLLDVDTVEKAQALAATDPGVRAGEFVAVARPMRVVSTLRQTGELERQMLAEFAAQHPAPDGSSAPASTASSPSTIRSYVFLSVPDVEAAEADLVTSCLVSKVVWKGRFSGDRGGVFVLDAERPEDVRATLHDNTTIIVDGWWSTKSLTKLSALR